MPVIGDQKATEVVWTKFFSNFTERFCRNSAPDSFLVIFSVFGDQWLADSQPIANLGSFLWFQFVQNTHFWQVWKRDFSLASRFNAKMPKLTIEEWVSNSLPLQHLKSLEPSEVFLPRNSRRRRDRLFVQRQLALNQLVESVRIWECLKAVFSLVSEAFLALQSV